jgi:hypothetical protein
MIGSGANVGRAGLFVNHVLQHWAFPGFLVDLQSSTGYDVMARDSSVHLSERVIGAK